jgi:hypothetical protein
MAPPKSNPLRSRADKLGLSCSTLSKATGIPTPTIKGWLRGSHYPRPKFHAALAEGLKVRKKTLERWLEKMFPSRFQGFSAYIEKEATMKQRTRTPRTRTEIKAAVAAYLERGGKITVLPDEPEYTIWEEDL